MKIRRSAWTIVTAIGLVAALASPAAAAPLVMSRDRSDNTHRFGYDATTGTMGEQTSGTVFSRRDPVAFYVFVRQSKSTVPGERLKARLSLGLNKDRIVRYDGTFTVEIRDDAGTVVYSDFIEEKIVLRPRPSERRASLAFVFDLPSGTYEASARFESAS